MPWEKDFDMDVALGDAMRTFWAKGYEATSMSDLTKAMKINKGSLYNAYGSKKELFTKALQKYDRAADQRTLRRLKKQKLQLRDRIQQIEDRLTPDIIA